MEKELLKLLRDYKHYKYMTAGVWRGIFTRNHGMSFHDFIQYLQSRKD